ncbi:zinc metalloprotease [Gaetbulibacter aestuarii]|uniref:Membrane metalloprotease n=1 Tax=Gaetbulibacter aestuarii TaxID=1502358 RepID=A0ABW7MWR0_9FLAO
MKRKLFVLFLVLTVFYSCSKDEPISSQGGTTVVNKAINRQTTGSSAHDLLSDDKFTSMVVELVYVEGYEPSTTTETNFLNFLQQHTYKPSGITVKKRSIPSPGQEVYTIDDIAQIERDNRLYYNSDKTVAVWAYFSDGKSDKDAADGSTVILGTAYWNTSYVIYEKTVKSLSGGPFAPSQSLLESTVIFHEFGHLFGLVNLGSPMQTDHEDVPNHPHHCTDQSCLMYWATESSIGISNISNTPPDFDSQCLADIQANGGK